MIINLNKFKQREKVKKIEILVFLVFFISVLFVFTVMAADPVGPDDLGVEANETKSSVSAKMLNISGGRIATIDLNATIQDIRWKGFVGNVTGSYTLDDAAGDTLFDWTISTITGRVYATRNSSAPTWASVNCSNVSTLETENYLINHSNSDDNITTTFNASINDTDDNLTVSGSHAAFYVGSIYLYENTCPTLNTYNNSATQDTDFEEIALYDEVNVLYATIMENGMEGFDDQYYDFQMIVPENGDAGFAGATAYYIYVEIGT